MDHAAAGHAAPSTTNNFTPAEVTAFHAEDRAAARNIVVLMLLIFLIGITLYTVVNLSIAS